MDDPISVSFAGELNVGGKVIYGLSTGGWKPNAIGDYRITFYQPNYEKLSSLSPRSSRLQLMKRMPLLLRKEAAMLAEKRM